MPLLGGSAAVVMLLRIGYRYMELRFQEREDKRRAEEAQEEADREHFTKQFDALMSTAASQVKTLEQLVDFIRRQWEQDSQVKGDLINKLETELRKLRFIMETCQRCSVQLTAYDKTEPHQTLLEHTEHTPKHQDP